MAYSHFYALFSDNVLAEVGVSNMCNLRSAKSHTILNGLAASGLKLKIQICYNSFNEKQCRNT